MGCIVFDPSPGCLKMPIKGFMLYLGLLGSDAHAPKTKRDCLFSPKYNQKRNEIASITGFKPLI